MPALPDLNGPLLFARYAFMPNRLGFCGGPNERGLFEACVEAQSSPELRDWTKQFEGAYPYLALIARANGLRDPLDYGVVEAYWLGNELLEGVGVAAMYDSILERFAPRLPSKILDLVLGKAPAGAQPFHAFHVLDVCRRTGTLAESLETLDNCRISWGRVTSVDGDRLWVNAPPLVFENSKLTLGPDMIRPALRHIDGRGFVTDARPGDWVSLHWGWVCDRLTGRQVRNLRHYTLRHLALANQTL